MQRAQAFGCAMILVVNVLGFALLAYLGARAGFLAPTNCGLEVTPQGCSATHADLAGPIFPVFWTLAVAIVALDFLWLLWTVVAQRLTGRQ